MNTSRYTIYGLAYGCETWAYPTNTVLATVAFLWLLDINLLSWAGITTHSYMTQQHLLNSFFVTPQVERKQKELMN